MVKCPDKALEKEDYKAFYNYINNPNNICDLYNYFLTYDIKNVIQKNVQKKHAIIIEGLKITLKHMLNSY